jgi:hypothetical protein
VCTYNVDAALITGKNLAKMDLTLGIASNSVTMGMDKCNQETKGPTGWISQGHWWRVHGLPN